MAILQRSFFGVKSSRRMRVAPKGKKYCADCDKAKPLSSFSQRKDAPDGRSFYCKECAAKRDKAYQSKRKASSWRRHYGISEHTYWEMFEEQGGVCAICGQPETWTHKGTPAHLAVDHDHATGQVRGLLCHRCNTALARFNDDIARFESAVCYLRKWK